MKLCSNGEELGVVVGDASLSVGRDADEEVEA